MAKKEHDKSHEVNFTGYGTKAADVVRKVGTVQVGDETFKDVVVAKDERGFYTTTMEYVRAPLLDPYRCYRRTLLGNADEIMAKKDDTADEKEQANGNDAGNPQEG